MKCEKVIMMRELRLMKENIEQKIEAENLTIHSCIHSDRSQAKKALLRRKALSKSLEMIQLKIDHLKNKEDFEEQTNTVASGQVFNIFSLNLVLACVGVTIAVLATIYSN